MCILKVDELLYLSFENSQCIGYITEKLFVNAFANRLVPIVAGPSRSDYERIVPKTSFIHVDDFATIEELSEHIDILDRSKEKYDAYFEWTPDSKQGLFGGITENLQRDFGWCKLCRSLEAKEHFPPITDLQKYWFGYTSPRNKSNSTCI